MNTIRSIAFYIAFYVGTVVLVMSALAVLPFNKDLFRELVVGWSRWHRKCVTGLLGMKVRIEGKIATEPVLYAIKHESFFEAIDAPTLLPLPAVFAKQELFEIPGWGKSALLYGLIPVARSEGAKTLRAMVASAKERVAEGRPLVIFPEGTRVPHDSAPPLQAGFAGLYKLVGLPVVPVAVDSGPLYHRKIKRPGTITYRIGETIPPGLPRAEAEAQVHRAMNALNDLRN